ncbi:MAG: phospholipase, partial [Prevotella sp.]|nr:phospholipase [Prevotella sp.]
FFDPVRRDGMILIDGGIINPIPLNRVHRCEGDILMGVDVSGHDYQGQTEMQQAINAKRKRDKSWKQTILNKIIPENIEFNTLTLLSRASSLMIRQNSLLMERLMKPDILLDIQLSRYTTFDFDKSEKLVAIGRQRAKQMLNSFEDALP